MTNKAYVTLVVLGIRRKKLQPSKQTGQVFQYSNMGTTLGAYAVEVVAKKNGLLPILMILSVGTSMPLGGVK